jgi:hypothetical protein
MHGLLSIALTRRASTVAAASFAAIALACASTTASKGPRETLVEYAAALEQGRVEEAYELLSDEAKKSIPLEAFRRMVKENPEEVKDIAQALTRPAGLPLVTATVTAPNGESLLLVYEDGAWRVDGSAIDLYGQSTPKASVIAFVRAFHNKRYDVLMRFVPSAKTEGLDAARLKQAWEGEMREEMEREIQAIEAALPTARFELLGDRATMGYGAGGTLALVREQGAWKIEDIEGFR